MTHSSKCTTVYLVDDQPIIRAAVRGLLVESGEFEVIGDSADARKAVLEIERLRPDAAVLDITMPGVSGIEAIALIRKVHPSIKLVILTHHESGTFVQLAMAAGAEGFVCKSADPSELMTALRTVMQNGLHISPRTDRGLVDREHRPDACSRTSQRS
jgi:DNA-binding NarL/FixJ family response regulator